MSASDDWRGLYREGWHGDIVPDAFTHPAKYARALIRAIYDHCAAEGWVSEGDTVCDPFGGVALGGLDAMRLGLHWTGVELEPRFGVLGNDNIALWNSRYAGRFARWGTARLLQGDSRRLASVVGRCDARVASPPFGGSELSTDENLRANMPNPGYNWSTDAYGVGNIANLPATSDGLAAAISSPPFGEQQDGGGLAKAAAVHLDGHKFGANHGYQKQATDDANLASLPATPDGLAAAIGSPPYASSDQDYKGGWARFHNGHEPLWRNDAQREAQYGESDGQLSAMPAGDIDAAVSSPPFENQVAQQDRSFTMPHDTTGRINVDYGETPGLTGRLAGDDFWHAARAIVEQVYTVLRPGGHACWVVKAFVRKGQLVDFPGQWRALCEAVGFVMLHEHRAWVVEDHGTQAGLDGLDKRHWTERKSFFRRLAEKKGSPRIDFEIVLCMEKPNG